MATSASAEHARHRRRHHRRTSRSLSLDSRPSTLLSDSRRPARRSRRARRDRGDGDDDDDDNGHEGKPYRSARRRQTSYSSSSDGEDGGRSARTKYNVLRGPARHDAPQRREYSTSPPAKRRRRRSPSRSRSPPPRRRDRSASPPRRRRRDGYSDSLSPPRRPRRSPSRSRSRSRSPPPRRRRHSRSPSHSPPRRSHSPPSRRSATPPRRSGSPFRRSRKPLPSQEISFRGEPGGENDKALDKPIEKQKPNFGTTGLLAAESNTISGTKIVLKYNEPPDARKPPPSQAWRLYVFKGPDLVDTIPLYTRSCWLIGREVLVADLLVEHPSCSKQHAVIQFRHSVKVNEFGDRENRVRPYVLDLESSNGTRLNGERIEGSRYFEVRDKDLVKFGLSEREYVFMLPPPD